MSGKASNAQVDASPAEPHVPVARYSVGGIYSATKAARRSAGNSLRPELAPEGVHVVGVHVSDVATAVAAHARPEEVPST